MKIVDVRHWWCELIGRSAIAQGGLVMRPLFMSGDGIIRFPCLLLFAPYRRFIA